MLKKIGLLIIVLIITNGVYAQWSPTGQMAMIPVYENCGIAGGRIGIAVFPPLGPRTIYMCQSDINELNAYFPGAGHFFYVHEFGHQALTSANEPATDCWASEQLAFTNNGAYYLSAAIRFFYSRGNEYHPSYGSGFDRARRLYDCAERVAPQRSMNKDGIMKKNSLPPALPSFETLATKGLADTKLQITEYELKPGLNYLLEASLSQFISLRGDETEDTKKNLARIFQGLVKLEDFENCRTYGKSIGYDTAAFRCDLDVSAEQTQSKFAQIVSQIKSLNLSSWKETLNEKKMFYQISEGEGKRTITLIVNDADNKQKQISLWINSPEQSGKEKLSNLSK